MEQQLGFTFYPKDWWTSDTFFLLTPFERYVYLELLFMMYSNDGFVSNNKGLVEGRLRTAITYKVWSKITDLLVEEGDRLTHRSVNKRLARILANRENGKKGGAPKGNSNASKQPKQPSKTTQNNPPYKEKENRIESEKESEGESPARTHEVVSDFVEEKPKPEWHTYTIDELEKEFIGSTFWKGILCKQYRINPGDIDPWITRFTGHLRASGEETKTLRDGKKHFSSWLRIQIDNAAKTSNGITPTGDSWRTDRTKTPTHAGDWRWSTVANRWMNRDNMSGSDQKKYGVER